MASMSLPNQAFSIALIARRLSPFRPSTTIIVTVQMVQMNQELQPAATVCSGARMKDTFLAR